MPEIHAIRLYVREAYRLREIARGRCSNAGNMPQTNRALAAVGLVEEIGGEFAKTGRRMRFGTIRLTEFGRAWLEAHPL